MLSRRKIETGKACCIGFSRAWNYTRCAKVRDSKKIEKWWENKSPRSGVSTVDCLISKSIYANATQSSRFDSASRWCKARRNCSPARYIYRRLFPFFYLFRARIRRQYCQRKVSLARGDKVLWRDRVIVIRPPVEKYARNELIQPVASLLLSLFFFKYYIQFSGTKYNRESSDRQEISVPSADSGKFVTPCVYIYIKSALPLWRSF